MDWNDLLKLFLLFGFGGSLVLGQTNPCIGNACVPPSICASSSGQVLCICEDLASGDLCEDTLFVPGTVVMRQSGTSGVILSPNYPDVSDNGIRYLYYIIQVPGAVRIEFQINFFCTELNKDFLFYGEGTSPPLDVFPGNLGVPFFHGCRNDTEFNVPDELVLEGDTAWFRFDADRNIPSPGFNITYNIVGNAPIATCPAPVSVQSQESNIGNTATWSDPVCSGIDMPDPSVFQTSCSRDSGDFFAGLGTNTVTCTCTDNLGASSDCSFSVTITPFPVNIPPIITCPGEVTTVSLPGNIGNTAAWPLPTCTDADSTANLLQITCDPPAGSSFPVGRNMAVCTCVDSRGGRDTCNVRVTITQDPNSVCNDNPCSPDQCRPTGRSTGSLYTCHQLLGGECPP